MYRAILPNGQLECESYEMTDRGIELFATDGDLLAFVPYESLEALLTESVYESEEPSMQ